jgi:hypothetical protein
MTIQITLTPEEERKLIELAHASGKEPAAHAHDEVSAYLNGARHQPGRSFPEILAPVWEEWRKSDLADCEVDDLFEEELRQARGDRRGSQETS